VLLHGRDGLDVALDGRLGFGFGAGVGSALHVR
jgi:hypothetical protein